MPLQNSSLANLSTNSRQEQQNTEGYCQVSWRTCKACRNAAHKASATKPLPEKNVACAHAREREHNHDALLNRHVHKWTTAHQRLAEQVAQPRQASFNQTCPL
eukprot:364902-Chlamydomonas_euryale.AAC.26